MISWRGLNNLHDDLLDLKITVEKAFLPFELDTSGANINDTNVLLPDKIFKSKEAESNCQEMTRSGVSTTDFSANANELLVIADKDNFISKYAEFNYQAFANRAVEFQDRLTECMSHFKNHLHDLDSFADTLYYFSRTNVTTGAKFIFEKESKVREKHYASHTYTS